MSDANWVGDRTYQKSQTRFLMYFGDTLVSWALEANDRVKVKYRV